MYLLKLPDTLCWMVLSSWSLGSVREEIWNYGFPALWKAKKKYNSEEDRLIRVEKQPEKHSISPHYFLKVDSPKIFLKLSIAI